MTTKLQLQNAKILSREEQMLIHGGVGEDAGGKRYYCTDGGAEYDTLASCTSNCSDRCLLIKDGDSEDPE